MAMTLKDLAPLKEICRKISLNIPDSYCWQWDEKRNMAVVILSEQDAEMVFYPLFKEFQHHWNFTSESDAAPSVTEFVNSEFGLMPGQIFFTSHMVCGLFLCVAWWPWGSEDKVSMRIGLIPANQEFRQTDIAFKCLGLWLDLAS